MAQENFTTAGSEIDGGNKLSQTATTATFTGLLGNTETAYYTIDKGANWKTGNFKQRFSYVITDTSHASNSKVNLLILGNSAFAEGAEYYQSIRVRFTTDDTTNTNSILSLDRWASGNTTSTPSESSTYKNAALANNNTIYCEYERASLVSTLKVYSDSGFTTLLTTLTVTEVTTPVVVRYLVLTATWYIGAATTISGSISNYDSDYSAGVSVAPSTATLTLTGATPTVTVTGNISVAPSAANLAATGATPTATAETYTWYDLPAPGSYDSNSILAGQTYPTGSWIRVVTAFAHITYNYAAAEAAGDLDNDINDHAVAESGYTGSDSATYEIKTPAGATSQYTVTATIQSSGATLGPSPASLSFTGSTPSVSAGSISVSPAAASLVITGVQPIINKYIWDVGAVGSPPTGYHHASVTSPFSVMAGQNVGCDIITPEPTYTNNPAQTFPLYIFFPGKGGNERALVAAGANSPAGQFNTHLGTAGSLPAILVSVNLGDNSFGYDAGSDAVQYGYNIETFIISYLLPYMAANYRADLTKVVLMGFSMGGCLAFRLASKFPALFLGCAMIDSPMPSNYNGTGGFYTTDSASVLDYLGYITGQARWLADNPRVNFNSIFAAIAVPRGFKCYIRRGSSGVTSQGSTWPGTTSADNIKLLAESFGIPVDYGEYPSGHLLGNLMADDGGNIFVWADSLISIAPAAAQLVFTGARPVITVSGGSAHYGMSRRLLRNVSRSISSIFSR